MRGGGDSTAEDDKPVAAVRFTMPAHDYNCPHCQAVLRSSADVSGRSVRCLGCQAVFVAQGQAPAAPARHRSEPDGPPLPPIPPSRSAAPAVVLALMVLCMAATGGALWLAFGTLLGTKREVWGNKREGVPPEPAPPVVQQPPPRKAKAPTPVRPPDTPARPSPDAPDGGPSPPKPGRPVPRAELPDLRPDFPAPAGDPPPGRPQPKAPPPSLPDLPSLPDPGPEAPSEPPAPKERSPATDPPPAKKPSSRPPRQDPDAPVGPVPKWGAPTQAEAAAIRAVRARGGVVERSVIAYLVELPTDCADEDLKVLADLPKATWVMIPKSSRLTDAGLARLLILKDLEHLFLHAEQVTDTGFKPLADLPKLTDVFLRGTKVTKAVATAFETARPGAKVRLIPE